MFWLHWLLLCIVPQYVSIIRQFDVTDGDATAEKLMSNFLQCCVCLMMMTTMTIFLALQGSWDPRWGRRKARPSWWRSRTWPLDHTASTHTGWLTGSSPRVGEDQCGSCGKPAAVRLTGADCSGGHCGSLSSYSALANQTNNTVCLLLKY